MMRLQKFLSLCGVASRRKAEEIIKSGRVAVNGNVVTEMGVVVEEGRDSITLDGSKVAPENKKIYIILNKPKGYITSVADQFDRPTVIDLIEGVQERIYPVGRLDYDTEGLLLITNDGDFANSITHPGSEIDKIYVAKISGSFDDKKLKKLQNGVLIDGRRTAPAKVKVLNANGGITEVKVTIHEGRNRQVKRMFEAVDCKVCYLKRISVGKFSLGSLQLGKWREFTETEIKYVEECKKGIKHV